MSLERRPSADRRTAETASPTRALVLATISFTVSFAAWGLVGGLASVFSGLYHLTASQTALLVAVPVLLGSLARLPMGILTDRFGGRLVFTALLGFSVARRIHRTADRQLQLAARRSVPRRHGGVVVLRRRGFRLPLDARRPTGHRPRRLWPGHDGPIAGRVRRPSRRRTAWLGSCVPRHERTASRLGCDLFPPGAESSASGPPWHLRRDGGDPPACAHRLAARRLLLPDLRRLRRVLDLHAHAAARAVRLGASGCRTSSRRIRRPRHVDAARWRLAGRQDRRCAGPLVGLRRRGAVLSPADVAVHGALHSGRARMRDADGPRQRRRL